MAALTTATLDAAAVTSSETKSAPAARKVNSDDKTGGDLLQNAVQMIVLPFLALAFVIIANSEAWYSWWRQMISPAWDMMSMTHLQKTGELQMDVFDPDDPELDWTRLQEEYINHGVPFVLRRKDGKPLSAVAPPADATEAAFAEGNIRVVKMPHFAPLPGLDECVKRLMPSAFRAYWPLWFLGRYSQGKAHIDLGPHTINCYFLRSGGKDVVVVPPEVTKAQDLQSGIDGLYLEASEGEGREYLAGLKYYYRVDLAPQSMLVFNNSSCIHQFRNVPDAKTGRWPEALSIRIKYTASADKRIWQHMALPWFARPVWWRFTGVFTDVLLQRAAEDREAKYL